MAHDNDPFFCNSQNLEQLFAFRAPLQDVIAEIGKHDYNKFGCFCKRKNCLCTDCHAEGYAIEFEPKHEWEPAFRVPETWRAHGYIDTLAEKYPVIAVNLRSADDDIGFTPNQRTILEDLTNALAWPTTMTMAQFLQLYQLDIMGVSINNMDALTPDALEQLSAREKAGFKAFCDHEKCIMRRLLPPCMKEVVPDDMYGYDRAKDFRKHARDEPVQLFQRPNHRRRLA